MGGFKGSFSITSLNYDKFVNLYKNALANGRDLYMVERSCGTSSFVVDIDFNFDISYNERLYTIKNIKYIISNFNDIINKYLDIDDDTKLKAFITEKPKPTIDKTRVKDGFHIYYPFIPISWEMKYFFMNEMVNKMKENKMNEILPFINPIEDVFDTSIIKRNGILMYGSHKEGKKPYNLTHIINFDGTEDDINDYTVSDLIDLFSLRRNADDDILLLNDDYNTDEFKKQLHKAFNEHMSPKDKHIVKNDNDEKQIQKVINYVSVVYDNSRDIEFARKLIKIISVKRASDFHDWISVGWTLHNISDKLLPEFKEFSKLCPEKYSEDTCNKVWNEARFEGYRIGTLRWWAELDNKVEYLKILREQVYPFIDKAFSGTHDDIAMVIYEMYKHIYKCVDINHNKWYEFKNDRWVKIDGAYTLKERISSDLTRELILAYSYFVRANINTNGEESKDCCIDRSKQLNDTCIKLKSTPFKNNVIEACTRKFYDDEFYINKLDENRGLLGFNNGVYDLNNGCFRRGNPDDCISLTTGYNYTEFDMDDEVIRKIDEFFEKILPNQGVRTYVLTLISSFLDGYNKEQKFLIWTGSGSNGKSCLNNLLEVTFGKYYKPLDVGLLTVKRRDPNSPSPALADKKGIRLCVMLEAEFDETIKVGLMKQLTGGDSIAARNLHEGLFEYKPQFKLVVQCNKLPVINADDGGTWRRLRVVKFGSKFVAEPKREFEYKIDQDLIINIKNWKQGFMWLLLNKYYPIYKNEGLKEPSEIMTYTSNYKDDNDFYSEFMKEQIHETDNDADCELLDDIYYHFKIWYKDSTSGKCPNKKDLKGYLINHKHQIKDLYVLGLRLILNENDEKQQSESKKFRTKDDEFEKVKFNENQDDKFKKELNSSDSEHDDKVNKKDLNTDETDSDSDSEDDK